MKEQIRNFVKSCESCQRKKLVRVRTKLPMVITDTPTDIFHKVAMDIVGPLPITKSDNRYLLTIQCNLTKFIDAIPIVDATAQSIGTAFATEFITGKSVGYSTLNKFEQPLTDRNQMDLWNVPT